MPLWNHQFKALEVLDKFLLSSKPTGASLISMPTGTGKTAVIGHFLASPTIINRDLNVLVISPWNGLARQLEEDIDSRIWQRLGTDRPAGLMDVKLVRSAKHFIVSASSISPKPSIHITTFKMLDEIFKAKEKNPVEMATLFERFSTVIVDECHYEPAPTWSQAVRATNRPICLFTATPFRNDNRMFDLHEDAQFRYSHKQAVEDSILREPKFVTSDPNHSTKQFVDSLIKYSEENLKPGERAIVRCNTSQAVIDVSRALDERGKKVIGFHDNFQANKVPSYLFANVQKPSERPNVEFYVHQNKLIEGFDDPAVRLLAIRHDFGNDRSRIQQIGRILRNPTGISGANAYVLCPDHHFKDAWVRYRNFDAMDSPISVATDAMGVATILDAQPEVFYWDRLFREKMDFSDDKFLDNLKFRLSTVIRRLHAAVSFQSLLEKVESEFKSSNSQILARFLPKLDTVVFLHLTVRNSPILRTAAYIETDLGYTALHWDGLYLFVSSNESIPRCIREETDPLEADRIASLLPSSAVVTAVSLANNDLSEYAISSRTLTAPDLNKIASEVGETTYGYSTASGRMTIDDDKVIRYTGSKNGRVTDQRKTEGQYQDLMTWFQELSKSLSSVEKPSTAITRYATPEIAPATPLASHVLLDFNPEDFKSLDDDSHVLMLESSGGDVSDESFKIVFDDSDVNVQIRWNHTRRRFDVSSPTEIRFRSIVQPNLSFWETITRNQNMRVATTNGLIYTNRNFWRISRDDSVGLDGILSILEPMDDLKNVVSEKGDTTGRKLWPKDTVFGVIDRMFKKGSEHEMENLLCTDMGPEIADFIATGKGKVIFIHAKSKKNTDNVSVSASALHEVASQAMKSLRYLTIGNKVVPKHDYWGEKWPSKKQGTTNRIRRGKANRSADQLWSEIDSVIQSHSATREVWLVLGACLSKKKLHAALNSQNPTPSSQQAHALLTSVWSTAQQCGIRLRVFCSP